MAKKNSAAAAVPADLVTVELLRPVNHDRQRYAPGLTVSMERVDADALIALGAAKACAPADTTDLPPADTTDLPPADA